MESAPTKMSSHPTEVGHACSVTSLARNRHVKNVTYLIKLWLGRLLGALAQFAGRRHQNDQADDGDHHQVGDHIRVKILRGDHQGGWVDETTPLTPATRRGRLRVLAERQWQAFADEAGLPLMIFRLAGIYGPGRSAIDSVRQGRARRIIKPGQRFNRIHVTDIANAVMASMDGRGDATILNVTDDLPAPPQDVIAYAAELLGLPPPPAVQFDEADLSPMARSFYGENKRVRNDLMKRDLGLELTYPTYREGLTALLRDTNS